MANPKKQKTTSSHVHPATWIIAASLAALSTGAVCASAGAAGILPPGNPSANVVPSSSDWLTSINAARAGEGVGAMALSEAAVTALPVQEQLMVVINRERLDRGLAPVEYMTAQLNAYALAGATAQSDPSFPAALSGGAPLSGGGSIWAGGVTSVFEADFYWMYDDGWGGSANATSNVTCTTASNPGCWDHRDIILHSFSSCAGGAAPTLSMGAADTSGSVAVIMVSTCGAAPSDVTLSWNQMATQAIGAQKVVGVAALPSGLGYWAASSNGAVSDHGSAADLGSMAGQSLNSPVVGIAATPDGRGYWLVAADGGIFSFGDAAFDGSTGAMRLNQPIVGMAVDAATGGYWLVAADGGIFSFDAAFFGSTGALRLNKPIVAMAALANGQGYRFVASDGGVFCFGQAAFDGSAGGQALAAPVAAMAPDQATGGYWLAGSAGGAYNFNAPSL